MLLNIQLPNHQKFSISAVLQSFMQQQKTQSRKDYHFSYAFGLFNSIAHFIVGIVWENSTTKSSDAILELPYFGGYLILLALAIGLLMIYQLIEHLKTDNPPKYMRVLSFIVSVIVIIISVLLIVVMSVRAHDYNRSEYKNFKQIYKGALILTILDVILTFFTLPAFFFVSLNKLKSVKQTKDGESAPEQQQSPNQNQEANPTHRVMMTLQENNTQPGGTNLTRANTVQDKESNQNQNEQNKVIVPIPTEEEINSDQLVMESVAINCGCSILRSY